jgi:DNA-binding response OmpR family regulator
MGQESVVLEAFKMGADDYMLKPFSPNELAMRVNRLLAVAN